MATIKDVAKYANVSIGTVSKYINGIKIKPANEERIKEAIHALDYRVNATARAMKTAKTSLVAILMDDLDNHYFPLIIKHIEQQLYRHGYNVFILDTNANLRLEREKIDIMLEKNVEGFIVFPFSADCSPNYQHILSQGTPLCVVDQYLPELPCEQVVTDNVGAAYQTTMQFLNHGHRRVGIITGAPNHNTATERLRGYQLAHESFGLPIDPALIHRTGFKESDGFSGMERLMTLDQPPTACLACNYETVQGAFFYARQHHIGIPDDLVLAGFDHSLIPTMSGTPIPIILQNVTQTADTAVNCLLEQMEHGMAQACAVHRIKADCSALDMFHGSIKLKGSGQQYE